MSIAETLAEREQQHGSFIDHAEIEAELRLTVSKHSGELTDVQAIGLGMIIHKISRVLNNGHMHEDSWHDIAGYATLVEQNTKDLNDFDMGIQADLDEIANER